jgi:hypothetical protein
MTTLQTVFPKDFDTKETPNDDHINHIMRLWYDYDLIGWFVYVVCLNDAKSCENNVYRAILGKHDVFPGDTMFSQCAPENTRFSYLSCKKLGFRCFRYLYTHMHCMCCLAIFSQIVPCNNISSQAAPHVGPRYESAGRHDAYTGHGWGKNAAWHLEAQEAGRGGWQRGDGGEMETWRFWGFNQSP